MKYIYFTLIFISILLGCKKEKSEKEIALEDYQQNYLGSIVDDPGWTGNTASCYAGNILESTNEKVLQRINYFRRLVGLNDNITLDNNNQIYMEAALICSANMSLSHYPPTNWLCWSQNAYNGCNSSNLGLGSHSSYSITGMIRDDGVNNYSVGHRRWILDSEKLKFSYGSTNNSMSLGCVGNHFDGNTEFPQFIAYPPNGYIPQELVFNRWSFSIPNENNPNFSADFSNAQINMSGPDGNVSINIVSRTDNGYGDNTIVWEPENILTSSNEDVEYSVTVSDIENISVDTYSYTVKIFKP